MIRSEEHLYYSGRDSELNYGIRGCTTQSSKKEDSCRPAILNLLRDVPVHGAESSTARHLLGDCRIDRNDA
jgi:hypothetical protein